MLLRKTLWVSGLSFFCFLALVADLQGWAWSVVDGSVVDGSAVDRSVVNELAVDRLAVARPAVDGSLLVQQQSDAEAASESTENSDLEAAYQLLQQGQALYQEGTAESLRQAVEIWQQVLVLLPATNTERERAFTVNNIAGVYFDLGERALALDYFQQALPLFQAVNDRDGEATVLNNMGNIYYATGEREAALVAFGQSLAINRELENIESQAVTLNTIGLVYNSLGESDIAIEHYQQALTLVGSLESPSDFAARIEAAVLSSLGNVYSARGETDSALEYYQQALPLSQSVKDIRGEAATLNNISTLYLGLNEPEAALEYLQQVLPLLIQVGDRSGEATALNNLGFAYRLLGDWETALEYYQRSLPLLRSVGARQNEAATLGNIAVLYQFQDQLPEATMAISEAIAIVEDLRDAISPGELRTSYFATVQDYYQLKIDLLMRQNQPEQAFETSEAARARMLLELLSEANVDIRSGVDPAFLAQEHSLRNQLQQLERLQISLRSREHTPAEAAALDRESDTLLQQLDQVLTQIRRLSPAYAETLQPQPLSLRHIQQQVLDADTVLVQYALGGDRSYLWLVGQEKFQSYTLPGKADIQTAAQQFQSAVVYRGNVAAVKRTGDALIAQILPELPAWVQNKRLLIAGDSILSELPFAALPLPTEADYVPLLRDHEILTQPSITAVSVLRKQLENRPEPPPSLAVLADPVYRADDERLQSSTTTDNRSNTLPPAADRNLRDLDLRAIQRLPYTRQESDNILALATQNNLKSISAFDFEASADWITAPALKDYSIIHLATHGFINPINPQLSGIVLSLVDAAGNLRENGFLRLHDIFNLDLLAELVVLSACQTGQGENVSGEGIIGLSRGFMYAGAERIAVSLWNVNDEATASLMSDFYRYLLEETRSPAAAMRAAQLEAWEAGQIPYLWAAFTLQGEWQ